MIQWNSDAYDQDLVERTSDACQGKNNLIIGLVLTMKIHTGYPAARLPIEPNLGNLLPNQYGSKLRLDYRIFASSNACY